jgi:exonuclease VII small subunit
VSMDFNEVVPELLKHVKRLEQRVAALEKAQADAAAPKKK